MGRTLIGFCFVSEIARIIGVVVLCVFSVIAVGFGIFMGTAYVADRRREAKYQRDQQAMQAATTATRLASAQAKMPSAHAIWLYRQLSTLGELLALAWAFAKAKKWKICPWVEFEASEPADQDKMKPAASLGFEG